MQLKNATQSDADKLKDRVYSAMETGNHSQARTLLREYAELEPHLAGVLRSDVIRQYSVNL